MYNVDLQVSKLCNCITNSSFETSYFRYFKATTSKTANEVGGSKNAENTTTDTNFADKEVDRKESKETEKNFEQKIVMFAVEHNLNFNSLNHLTKLIKEAAKIPANSVKLSRTTKIVLDTFAPCQQKKRCEILHKTIFHHNR
jgi:hypothetical protein